MFKAAKDLALSSAAKAWANNFISRYGAVQTVKIDSSRKTIEVTCLLEGEVSPITIAVADYSVETEGTKKFIRAARFSCSRPWLEKVLTDFGSQKRIELPPWAASAL